MANFPPYNMNREAITRLIQNKIAEIPAFGGKRVLLETPSVKASFPVCVLSNFQARPKYFKAAYDLSITVEIWANGYYEAQALYDQVVKKLAESNFVEVAMTPQEKDPIVEKQRYGSTFEAGWSAIDNTFFINRS